MVGNNRNAVLFLCLLTVTFARVLWQMSVDQGIGGSPWRQGDWLITDAAGPIRRAMVGNVLTWVSDRTGLPLLALVQSAQAGLFAACLVGIGLAALRAGISDRLLILLLSPGFVLFWASDPEASLRKELFAILAFLPLVLTAGPRAAPRGATAATLLLFSLAVAAHEANAFFAPTLMAAIAMTHRGNGARVPAMLAVAALAAVALLLATRHVAVPDAAPICAALLVRGLDPNLCTGAIAWLQIDPATARARVAALAALPAIWTAGISYAAALIPFAVYLHGSPRAGRHLLAGLAAGAAFLPLWFVAVDWGRWINFHMIALVFLTLILVRRDRPAWAGARLPRGLALAALALCLCLGISHVGGFPRPGLLPQAMGIEPAPPVIIPGT